MEIQNFTKIQRPTNQCSRSLEDILQLPLITHEDSENNPNFKPRAESFDSKDSPHMMLKEHFEINNVSNFMQEHKEKKQEQKPKIINSRKMQFMRNLAPIDHSRLNGNSVQISTTDVLLNVNNNNNELDKWTRKERSHRSFNDSNDLNNGLKSEIDSFKSEIANKFEQISEKMMTLESKLEAEHKKNCEIQQKNFELILLYEQNSQTLKSAFEEQLFKLEQATQFKYQKIKEYFSKFGDQFKSHLRLYDKKKNTVDSRLDCLEDFMKKVPNLHEDRIQEVYMQTEAKITLFEAEKREEFKRIFDQLKRFKDELNIHSIVHSEFQGMFELQNMVQNDNKREFIEFESQTKEMANKLDLQMVFQRELENEMKMINETQADLFKGFKKHDGELDNLGKILQNLSSNYNIFKKVQEKETVIKTQLIDLLQDINILKNKINSDGEMEKSMRKLEMEEIHKAIDKKFEIIRIQNERKEGNDSINNEK